MSRQRILGSVPLAHNISRALSQSHVFSSVFADSPYKNIQRQFTAHDFGRDTRLQRCGFGALLLAIVILSAVLFSYNLDSKDLWEDEYQVVSAAAGYYHVGNYYYWDWIHEQPQCIDDSDACYYDRAWPHSILIAQSFKMFGISEWSSRIVSVLAMVAFVFLSYFFTRFFVGSRTLALMAAFLFSIHPQHITLAQYARMYSLLVPLSLILMYLFYRGIAESNPITLKYVRIKPFMRDTFDFNYVCLAPAFALLYFTYHIHINVLVLLPAIYLFVVYLALVKKEKKFVVASVAGLAGITALLGLVAFSDTLSSFAWYLSFFERYNLHYLHLLGRFPFNDTVGAILLLSSVTCSFIAPRVVRDKLVYLSLIVVFAFVFFVCMTDRYPSSNYISHITPVAVILILISWSSLAAVFRPAIVKMLILALIIASGLSSLYAKKDSLYGTDHQWGKVSTAYATILENYDPDTDAVFGQYLRRYYLQGISKDFTEVDMLSGQAYKMEQFSRDLLTHPSGWVTWETRKTNQIDDEVREFIDSHFLKVHGRGVDDTEVEVYHFDASMMEGTESTRRE